MLWISTIEEFVDQAQDISINSRGRTAGKLMSCNETKETALQISSSCVLYMILHPCLRYLTTTHNIYQYDATEHKD
jgi:hypothetical protein